MDVSTAGRPSGRMAGRFAYAAGTAGIPANLFLIAFYALQAGRPVYGFSFGTANNLVKLRPALRSEELFANIYGLCSEKGAFPKLLQMAVLVDEHWDEGHLTKPPPVVQNVMLKALVPVGKLLGYKAHYPKYSGLDEHSGGKGEGPPSAPMVEARAVALVALLSLACSFVLFGWKHSPSA